MGELAVAHDPANVAAVRHSIAADLADRHLEDDVIDDVVLVASELVTNALLYAPPPANADLDVTWDVLPDCIVIGVRDRSAQLPRPRPADRTDPGGRGLHIVAQIARDWGVRRNEQGKQVWAAVATLR